MMNIHLKIESKIKGGHMMAIAPKQSFMKPVEFVESYYKTFEKIHGLEYRVQKLSKRARKS